MNDLFGVAKIIDNFVALIEEVVQIADDRSQVLTRRDRSPSADRVKAHSDGSLGQQRGRFVRLHLVGVVDAQHEERSSIACALAVLAGASASGKLVRTEDVLRPEVPRSQTVDTREEPRHLLSCDRR